MSDSDPMYPQSDEDTHVQTVRSSINTTTSTLTLLRPELSQNGMYRCVARDGAQDTHCANQDCVLAVSLSNSARVQVLGKQVYTCLIGIPAHKPLLIIKADQMYYLFGVDQLTQFSDLPLNL